MAPTLTSTEHLKPLLVPEIRKIFAALGGTEIAAGGTCIYWSAACIIAGSKCGVRVIPQAGSASFRYVPPHLDDGVRNTHFSYLWEGPEVALEKAPQHLLNDGVQVLPEMHCWAAIVQDGFEPTLLDFSTAALPEVCQTLTGSAWLEASPPPYLWSPSPPDGWHYNPNEEATEFAVQTMQTIIKRGR